MAELGQSRRGVVMGALAGLVIAAGVAVMRQRNTPDLIVQSDEGWAGEMRVAVAGEVVTPGTYTLKGDARLADLIAAAGGYTDTAARDVLNPAARISDGQAYTIPVRATPGARAATATARTTTPPRATATPGARAATATARATMTPPRATVMPSPAPVTILTPTLPEVSTDTDAAPPSTAMTVQTLEDVAARIVPEIVARESTPETPTRTPRPPRAPRSTASGPARRATAAPKTTSATRTSSRTRHRTRTPASVSPSPPAPRVRTGTNINTATEDELASLPSIGPARAKRIAEDRLTNGPYVQVNDLARVRGISARMVNELRDRVTLG